MDSQRIAELRAMLQGDRNGSSIDIMKLDADNRNIIEELLAEVQRLQREVKDLTYTMNSSDFQRAAADAWNRRDTRGAGW